MRLLIAFATSLLFFLVPAQADELTQALNRAITLLDAAQPKLGSGQFGVNTARYRDALVMGRFEQGGQQISLYYEEKSDPGEQCGRFAAYTLLPAHEGVIRLVICPRFFSPGADDLRALTILHELVHAVTDTNECRAMAYAARVEYLAMGRFTPVDAYWRANDCAGSGFALP